MLRATATAGATAFGLGAAGSSAAADEDAYGGYLASEGTWGGVTVDATGEETVEVAVGAAGNGEFHAFDPAALAVDPGTTVRWKWTGEGGGHDVVHDTSGERRFNSEREHGNGTTAQEGFVYEATFEDGQEGVYPYFCSPHLDSPMVGVVVVGGQHVETDTVPLDQHTPAPRDGGDDGFGPGFGVFGLLAAAVLGGAGVLYTRHSGEAREDASARDDIDTRRG